MNWTDERVDVLKKLWNDGFSANQIAIKLGDVSRNAVIGKVHRLKLTRRGSGYTSHKKNAGTNNQPLNPPSARKPSMVLAKSWQKPEDWFPDNQASGESVPFSSMTPRKAYQPTDTVLMPPSRRLQLIELTDTTCRWPSGDPAVLEEFNFCGNYADLTGRYCAFHARLAYQPASERKRLR